MRIISYKYLIVPMAFTFLCSCGSKKNALSNQESVKIDSMSVTEDSIQKQLSANKSQLDSLFIKNNDLDSFKKLTELGEILIGDLFSTSEKYAVFAYKLSDTTLKTIVLKKAQHSWDTVLTHISDCYYSEFMPARETIELVDLNGDNAKELRIVYNYWDIHPGDQGYVWTLREGNLIPIKNFENVISPEYDNKTSKIYSYQSDGCADMSMEFWTYEIRNDKIIQTSNIHCDCCESESGFCFITIGNGTKKVDSKEAYKYVPKYFERMVKWKTGVIKNKIE